MVDVLEGYVPFAVLHKPQARRGFWRFLRSDGDGLMEDYASLLEDKLFSDPDIKRYFSGRSDRRQYARQLAARQIDWALNTHEVACFCYGGGDLLMIPCERLPESREVYRSLMESLGRLISDTGYAVSADYKIPLTGTSSGN